MSEPDEYSAAETEALGAGEHDGPLFDNYRSVRDPTIVVFVKTGNAAPFRFKAGGWDLVRSSIALEPAIVDRIMEHRFFMCRVNEDGSEGTELIDFPAPVPTSE